MYNMVMKAFHGNAKHKVAWLCLLTFSQLLLNIAVGVAFITPDTPQTIPAGITVQGEEVGGLNSAQAVARLKSVFADNVIDKEIRFEDCGRKWVLRTRDYGFCYDFPKTVEAILLSTRWMNTYERNLNLLQLQACDRDFPLLITWDNKKLQSYLSSINEQVQIPPQDARIQYYGNQKHIVADVMGKAVDIEFTIDRVVRSIQSGKGERLHLVKKNILPDVIKTDLEKIDAVLAVYSTEISHADPNRAENIITAARALDGAFIPPDDIFSFNDRIGERTPEKGYKKAPIIMGNSVVKDTGGGVCQLATTLYNASLIAELDIIERYPHTIPVKYAPQGQDATVFYNSIDLKLRNNRPNPIFISCVVENDRLVVSLLGNHEDK